MSLSSAFVAHQGLRIKCSVNDSIIASRLRLLTANRIWLLAPRLMSVFKLNSLSTWNVFYVYEYLILFSYKELSNP